MSASSTTSGPAPGTRPSGSRTWTSTVWTPRSSMSAARCCRRTRRCGSTACAATTAGCRTLPRMPRAGCWVWPRSRSTPPSWPSRSCARAAQPGLVIAAPTSRCFPAADDDYGEPDDGIRCGRRFSIPGCPVGLHVGGRRPGTPAVEHLRERAAVHDRPGHEQDDHGRGRLRADPRTGHAALSRT